MKPRLVLLVSVLVIASMLLTACPAPEPQVVVQTVVVEKEKQVVQTVEVEKKVVETQIVEKVVQATRAPEPKPIVTWFQYDQHNVDPKSDERVGNEYLRKAIPAFNKEFKGQWIWDNQFTPWNRLEQKLIAGVLAKAEVADIVELGSNYLNNLYKNGAVQDLTEWAKAQSWYSEMDSSALATCTGLDGKLYCIPVSNRPSQVFVWADRFPNGFPKTTDEFLVAAEQLKQQGLYAMTFFGSTAYNGDGANRAVFQVVGSFGGGYDDGNGKLALNTPENVAAVAWLREVVQKGYVPEISFAGGFQEEEAFKDASAAIIPTGLFGYRYINPLTTPSGKKYEKKTEQDMIDAIDAGDVILKPFPAGPGGQHGCAAAFMALYIPTGATNVEGAYDLINWVLSPKENPAYVLGPGGGLPVLKSVAAAEQFQSKFYQEAIAVASESNCKLPWPTIVDITAAKTEVMNAVYKLIKTDPTADIATELQKAEDEFNKTVK